MHTAPYGKNVAEIEHDSRGGSTFGPGGTQARPVGQAPQIFWFQQQKYVVLKFRLFLYSGKINTRIV